MLSRILESGSLVFHWKMLKEYLTNSRHIRVGAFEARILMLNGPTLFNIFAIFHNINVLLFDDDLNMYKIIRSI